MATEGSDEEFLVIDTAVIEQSSDLIHQDIDQDDEQVILETSSKPHDNLSPCRTSSEVELKEAELKEAEEKDEGTEVNLQAANSKLLESEPLKDDISKTDIADCSERHEEENSQSDDTKCPAAVDIDLVVPEVDCTTVEKTAIQKELEHKVAEPEVVETIAPEKDKSESCDSPVSTHQKTDDEQQFKGNVDVSLSDEVSTGKCSAVHEKTSNSDITLQDNMTVSETKEDVASTQSSPRNAPGSHSTDVEVVSGAEEEEWSVVFSGEKKTSEEGMVVVPSVEEEEWSVVFSGEKKTSVEGTVKKEKEIEEVKPAEKVTDAPVEKKKYKKKKKKEHKDKKSQPDKKSGQLTDSSCKVHSPVCPIELELAQLKDKYNSAKKEILRLTNQLDNSRSYNTDLRERLDTVNRELDMQRKNETHIIQLEEQVIKLSQELLPYQQAYKRTYQNKKIQVDVEQMSLSDEANKKQEENLTLPDWNVVSSTTETKEPMSIAESVKAAASEALEEMENEETINAYQKNKSLYEAQQAAVLAEMVYDASSGMYYSESTGYYYDAERYLYYEPNSGTYYYYDYDAQQYKVHSQVDLRQYTTGGSVATGHSESVNVSSQLPAAAGRSGVKKARKRKGESELLRSIVSTTTTEKTVNAVLPKRPRPDTERVSVKQPEKKSLSGNGKSNLIIIVDDEETTSLDGSKEPQETKKENDNLIVLVDNNEEKSEANDDKGTVCGKSNAECAAKTSEENTKTEEEPEKPLNRRQRRALARKQHEEELAKAAADEKLKEEGAESNMSVDSANVAPPVVTDDQHFVNTQESAKDTYLGDLAFWQNYRDDELKSRPEKGKLKGVETNENGREKQTNQTRHIKLTDDTIWQQASDRVGSFETLYPDRPETRISEPFGFKINSVDLTAQTPTAPLPTFMDNEDSDSSVEEMHVTVKPSWLKTTGSVEAIPVVVNEPQIMPLPERLNKAIETASRTAPCIRFMVLKSNCLDIGTLFIATYCGSNVVGRDKSDDISIHIPEDFVSRKHAQFTFDPVLYKYILTDLKSQNGTLVNSFKITEPYPVEHEDMVQFGSTLMAMHIHPGSDTCDDCEPGVVRARIGKTQTHELGSTMVEDHKTQMRNIKKKYGLSRRTEDHADQKACSNPNYSDRAIARRTEPVVPVASVDRAITKDNVGHKMMSKMGWTAGTGLGKGDDSIKEPIQVSVRMRPSAGLGSGLNPELSLDEAGHPDMMRPGKQRYSKAYRRYAKQQGIDIPEPPPEPSALEQQWVKGDRLNPEEEDTHKLSEEEDDPDLADAPWLT